MDRSDKRVRFSDETETLEERTSDRRKRFGPVATLERSTSVTPEVLARKWHIGKERAKQTLKVTTQRGIRNIRNPLTKRLRTQRWRNKRMIPGKWYSDTMHFKVKSIMRKETVAQIFSNGFGYEEFYPCEREARCHEGLSRFVNEIGIPEHIVVDGARAQGSHETYNTSWQKLTKAYNIKQTWIQPYCWFQNKAEGSISEIRQDMRRLMATRRSPGRLWGYLGTYVVGRRQRTSSNSPEAMGRTPFELVHGYVPDITPYVIHDWYDFVWWMDQRDHTEKLGRWLGPAGSRWGGGDCYHILHQTGKIHTTNAIRPISSTDWKNCDVL